MSSVEPTAPVPGVPGTAAAGLPGGSMRFWYGFFVRTGTPAGMARKLFDATQEVCSAPT